MASAGISQEVADILREKHGFSFGDKGAFVSPTGAQVPIMLHEGGVVHVHNAGGQEVRTLDEGRYAGQQYTVTDDGKFDQLYTAPPPSVPDSPIPPQAPLAPTSPPAAPVAPAPVQVMDVAPPVFSGDPLPPPVPLAPTPPPVPPSGGVGAILKDDGTIDNTAQTAAMFKGNPGFYESDFYKNLPPFGTMDYYTASDGTEFGSGTTGRAYDQYLASLATAPPPEVPAPAPEVPAPAQPELTPIQQAAQELQELGETVGFSTKRKQRNDDIVVSYKDGTKTSDILKKYGITRKEWNKATSKPGQPDYSSNRSSAIGLKKTGIEYALMSDEERQAVVDSYLAGKAQERKEDKKDAALFGTIDGNPNSPTYLQRTGGSMQDLNAQVKKEADRLGITTDQFYGYDAAGNPVEGGLSFSDKAGMAVQDFKEVFDPSLGPLFQNPDAMDPDNARSLGILAPTGAITSDRGPMPRPDNQGLDFGPLGMMTPYGAITSEDPTGSNLIGTYDMVPGGGLLPDGTSSLVPPANAQEMGPGEDLAFTQNALYSGVFKDPGSPPEDFILKLASFESGTPGQIGTGNYQSVNKQGYAGLLNFGQPRLDDYNNEFGTDIQLSEFTQDNDLQDKVNLWHIGNIDEAYDKLNPMALAETGIDRDGFRAAAHLGGVQGATDFVNSGGQDNPSDANNKSLAKYAEDLKKVEPEPVQTAGLNFSLSDLNPFRAASAATVPGDDDYEPIPYSELGGSPGAMGGELVPGQDFGGPSFTPDFDYVAPGMSPGAMGRMANPAVLAAEQDRLFQGAGDLFSNDLEYNIAGGLAEETGQAVKGLAMTADEIAEEYTKQDPSLVYDTNNPRNFFQRPLKVFSGYDPYEVDPSLIQALEGTNIPGYSGIADQGAAPTYEQQNPDINVVKEFVSPVSTYLEEVAEGLYDKISPGMKLRQEQALPEEGTTLTDVLSGDAKDRLGRTYGTDFVATAMTGGQEVGDLVVDGLVLAITKNPALAFGTVATTSYGAAAQSASEQGRALVRAGLESGEIQKSKEFKTAVKEFGSEERAIKQLLDRVDEYSKTAGTVGALGDVVLAKFAGVLPGSSLVPKVVTKTVPGSVKKAGKAVVQTGKALGSGGAGSLTEATEGALANIGAQQAGSPVDIMTGTGADALLGYAGSTAGQAAVGLGQTVAGAATSAKNALSDEAIIQSATAPSTTVIPGAGPNIATDLNIQSPEAGVVNTTPFNVANLSKVSTPSGISTLAIPGQPGALPTNIDTTQPYTQTPNYLYGAGPTIKPSGVAPGGVANITAPAGDTAVNFPSSFSTLETPAVDQEAMDVIAKVDAGGRPFAMTNNLLRILRNNNITADANTDPAEAIAALKVKASSAPSGVASLSTLGDPSNVTPPKPFVQAQQAIIQEIVETGGLSVKTANRLSNDLNMSMPEITRIAENAMGLDMSTPALSGPAPRTDMLPSGVSTLADTKGIGNLILNPPPVGKVPVRDKDTGKLTSAVANPVKTSIAADPTLLSMPTDTDVDITTETDVAPAVATDVTTDVDTTTTVDVDDTITPLTTVDIPPEEPIEIEVDEPTAEDPINIVEEETDDDKPPFECPDGFTAVKVDGQFVCMPDEEEEDDGADTVIQKVRPRIASYYRPNTNAVLENYTPYRPYGR